MKLIAPIAMSDAQLTASNLPEDDHATYNPATTYAEQTRVISTTTHRIYESVQNGNVGNALTDTGWWLNVGATNRWKPFDGVIADQASSAGAITYSITPNRLVSGIAMFGVDAAEVRVQVYDNSAMPVKIYDTTKSLVDDSDIIDYITFFTTDLVDIKSEALFVDLLAFPGYRIDITVGDGAGPAKVGEIVLGKLYQLGTPLEGTTIGLTSFSKKEQDTFGNWNIVKRAKSDPIDFQFAMKAGDSGRVKRVLNSVRDTPAVYFADETLESFGAQTFGLFQDYRIPLIRNGVSVVSLEIEGLT